MLDIQEHGWIYDFVSIMKKLFRGIEFGFLLLSGILIMSCSTKIEENTYLATLMTADPGHFHAALVQKVMYPAVNPKVYVFAPDGPEVQDHLNRIEGFNLRENDPTSWETVVYTGDDFFEKMIDQKPGNVLVLAGNNQKKTEYILEAIRNDIHVYSDKPMAINTDDFELLKEAFVLAEHKGLLLYDVMTERFEITSMMQKEMSLIPEIFGQLEEGTPDNPAVVKESVHHFFKYVSGSKIKRPPWFFDVTQEGDGIVDVTTHLVDLIQWTCYSGVILDYQKDIKMISASRWSTGLNEDQFEEVTQMTELPDYLDEYIDSDDILQVFCNGEMTYKLKNTYARVKVEWKYQAPEGTGDTHYSILRGTLADLEIRQGEAENYKPELYLIPHRLDVEYKTALMKAMSDLESKYQGVSIEEHGLGYHINIPEKYKVGHEAHFAQVTERFLEYLEKGKLPAWEIPNMIAKYYTTTAAFEMAKMNQ